MTAPPPTEPPGGTGGSPGLGRIAASLVREVAALASFVAALMFYAGVMYDGSYYGYFHLDVFGLGFGFPEFIVASLHLIRLPAVVAAGLLLVALRAPALAARHPLTAEAGPAARTLHEVYRRLRRAGSAIVRGYAVVALCGLLLLLFWDDLAPYQWLAPLTLAVGLLLGQTRTANDGAVPTGLRDSTLPVLAVGLLLVWIVALVATQLGHRDAEVTARRLNGGISVIVYSKDLLGIPLNTPEDFHGRSAYRYRYTGLRLILQRSDRYFIVPVGWRHATDPVSILQQSDSIRVDLAPGARER